MNAYVSNSNEASQHINPTLATLESTSPAEIKVGLAVQRGSNLIAFRVLAWIQHVFWRKDARAKEERCSFYYEQERQQFVHEFEQRGAKNAFYIGRLK